MLERFIRLRLCMSERLIRWSGVCVSEQLSMSERFIR
jgi:hypothetical protein